MNKKIAYAIARESADDKTLQHQYEDIQRAAKDLGYEITRQFGENVSGDVTRNDGQDSNFIVELRQAIKEKKPDAIFCYWIDRMTRTTYKQGAYLNEFCVIPKIPIFFTRKRKWTIDPDTGMIDNEFLAELAADTTPQRERENIVARTTPRRQRVAEEGYYIGHLSDGYRVQEEWGTWEDGHRRRIKTIVIDQERKIVIEQIFKLFIQGYSTAKIADYLNAKDVPTTNRYRSEHHDKFGHRALYRTKSSNGVLKHRADAKWSSGLVSQILQNEWYKGIRHYQGIEHRHDPIVSTNMWEQAQSIRNERYKSFRSTRESTKHTYLLQDLLFCGKCGNKMYGHYTGLNNHYYCSSIEFGQKCGLRGVCKENIEGAIYDCCTSKAIQSVIRGEDSIFSKYFKLSNSEQERIRKEIKDSKIIIHDLKKQIEDLGKQIQTLIELQATNYANPAIQERYAININERYNEIQKKEEKIKKELSNIRTKKKLLTITSDAKKILENIRQEKNLINIKRFFQTVIDKVIIYNTEGRNDIVRIKFKTGQKTEFIYAAQAMPGRVMPMYEPLYYDESTNSIESTEYPVYLKDGIPFTHSTIEEYSKKSNTIYQRYAQSLDAAILNNETLTIEENSIFTVRDYIIYLKSLPSYKGIPSYSRLEETDELGQKQREHYRQWRKKYNTGRPSQEPYILHDENYEEICTKRKHLYNRRYKIKNNKSLSEEQKRQELDEIKKQLNLLSAQVSYLEGYNGKRKKRRSTQPD